MRFLLALGIGVALFAPVRSANAQAGAIQSRQLGQPNGPAKLDANGLFPPLTAEQSLARKNELAASDAAAAALAQASAASQAAALALQGTAAAVTPLAYLQPPIPSAQPPNLPATLPGCALWLDADAGVSNAAGSPATDGQAVAKWADQCSSGNDAVAPQVGNPPTLHAASMNGHNTLSFNGASQQYLREPYSGEPGTVFVVYRLPATGVPAGATYDLLGADSAANGPVGTYYMQATSAIDVRKLTHVIRGTSADAAAPASSFTASTSQVYGAPSLVSFTDDGSTLQLYRSGRAAGPAVVRPAADTLLPIKPGSAIIGGGYYGHGGVDWLTGDIAAVVVFDHVLTAAQHAAVSDFLISRYGLAGYSGQFLFAGMQGTYGTGNEGLVLARSDDGINWTYQPSHLVPPAGHVVRDPSIKRFGNGYVLVTSNLTLIFGLGSTPTFDVYYSPDLFNWTLVASPDCSAITGSQTGAGAWAPDLFVDDDGSLHVVVSLSKTAATTLNGFATYELHPTSADLSTWSQPQPMTGTDAVNAIDGTVHKAAGVYTMDYSLFVTGQRYIQTMTAPALLGPWTQEHVGDWTEVWGQGYEGPIVMDYPDGRRCVYLDNLGNGYQVSCSTDLGRTWGAKQLVNLPGIGEHGSIIQLYGPGSTQPSGSGTVATPVSTATAAAPLTQSSGLLTVSKVRLTQPGGSFIVPSGVSWLQIASSATVPAQTLIQPVSPVDGQLLIVTTSSAVAALTFSPSVTGWANGTPLPAGSGLTIGFDAASLSWTRVQ